MTFGQLREYGIATMLSLIIDAKEYIGFNTSPAYTVTKSMGVRTAFESRTTFSSGGQTNIELDAFDLVPDDYNDLIVDVVGPGTYTGREFIQSIIVDDAIPGMAIVQAHRPTEADTYDTVDTLGDLVEHLVSAIRITICEDLPDVDVEDYPVLQNITTFDDPETFGKAVEQINPELLKRQLSTVAFNDMVPPFKCLFGCSVESDSCPRLRAGGAVTIYLEPEAT